MAEALRQAVREAEAAGLAFAPPITVTFSDVELDLIVDRVIQESKKVKDES